MEKHTLEFGIVLSGGGHKGLAHAGVLKFLNEVGIHPQVIAGTSAGSIVGSLYAQGLTPDQILAFFQSVSFFSWSHITFKKAGFLDANSFGTYLKEVFEEKTLGELEKDLFITATDISRGKLKIFNQQTKITDAVLASSAFPGVFSPVIVNGKLYSDGGILNNFPVNTIQGRCDFIIGVNVCPMVDSEVSKFTSIKSVAIRAYEIMTMHNSNASNELCDWYIEPQALATYNTFETNKKRMEEIFNIGYQEAKKTYKNLKDKIR